MQVALAFTLTHLYGSWGSQTVWSASTINVVLVPGGDLNWSPEVI